MKKLLILLLVLILFGILLFKHNIHPASKILVKSNLSLNKRSSYNPLSINYLKSLKYNSSKLVIVQKFESFKSYNAYEATYSSDGYKIYGELTIPTSIEPLFGFPAILFNHGYIEPETYSTFQSYASYVNTIASNGYIVFKPDYRGNGNSMGTPHQIYIAPDYVIDDLNALYALKHYIGVNPNKIGVYGHSMGGNITLHDLVIDPKDFKAAVIWSGVVGNYTQIINWWQSRITANSIYGNDLSTANVITQMIKTNKTPTQNPIFWNMIDPTYYIQNIQTPVELDVSANDNEVPPSFSFTLDNLLKKYNKTELLYAFPGSNHNISQSYDSAMQNTITFFNKYLK